MCNKAFNDSMIYNNSDIDDIQFHSFKNNIV